MSYLGVGLQAPTPSLGNILNDSVAYYQPDPTFFFAPGVVLVLVVLSFNLFGDGLRDALDPCVHIAGFIAGKTFQDDEEEYGLRLQIERLLEIAGEALNRA